mgnify:FL=1
MRRPWFHAKGRMHYRRLGKTHVYMHIVEVPAMENERRLGRYGWTNKQWEKHERQQLADLQEKQRAQQEQEAAAAEAAQPVEAVEKQTTAAQEQPAEAVEVEAVEKPKKE